ncbi:MarR family winged helix-turn-helix transcriptional regulator [Amycolatopsis cihanbeyliensis]|uniref:DNA-binding MarR family transcriptional regulator n=1 Tax=Amycolatopsis cihanbeyliensis TaxID=1128664 RepID=A0A542DQU1_AMYCI|nr:MarR family transcriptional regulator [Amycolatopsis cihanbeyliensis]TQJ05416.1 DNA-binding MarR family transcriptional regulator [Amycolatopsis cihanbeyliensis]
MSDTRGGSDNPSSDAVDEIQRSWLRERPGTPVSSIGVITRIWQISKLLEEDRRETMLRLGMDSATRDLLSALRRVGEPYRLTASELAHRMLVTAGAVSQRVARAEKAGLVRRVRSTQDRRGVFIELTPEGHATIERTVDLLLLHEDELLAELSPEQREQLADLLRVLLGSLRGRAGV